MHRHLTAVAIIFFTLGAVTTAASSETSVDLAFDDLLFQHYGDDLLVDYEVDADTWNHLQELDSMPRLVVSSPSDTDETPLFTGQVPIDERRGSHIVEANGQLRGLDRIEIATDSQPLVDDVTLAGWRDTRLRIEVLPEGSSVILFDDLDVEPVGDQPVAVDELRPRADRPTRADRQRPRLDDRDRPRHIERERPSLSDRETPSLSDRERPSRADRDRPSQADRDPPRKSDRERPRRIERDRPASTDREAPRRIERERPSIIDRQRPRR